MPATRRRLREGVLSARAVLRRIGFEVHEGRYGEAGETYTVFACVRPE
jgi:hypothetical protein